MRARAGAGAGAVAARSDWKRRGRAAAGDGANTRGFFWPLLGHGYPASSAARVMASWSGLLRSPGVQWLRRLPRC